jgi:hypothetical protein
VSWLLWLYGQGLQQAGTWILVAGAGALAVIWTVAAAMSDRREDEDERER